MVLVSCDFSSAYIFKNNNTGLGNQLFQIANVLSFCKDNNLKPVFPQIETSRNSKKYRKSIFGKLDSSHIDNLSIYNERSYFYNEINVRLDRNVIFKGYFQSYKYFSKHRDLILKSFEPTEEIKSYIEGKYGKLLKNSTSIHVRLGDYLSLDCYHNLIVSNYYKNAIKITKSDNILVFSDNITEVKKNIYFQDPRITFVENENEIIDFYMMSFCENNVIGNSTFSWWAAWMNLNKVKKVYAPNKWFKGTLSHYNTKDLIPEEWTYINI